jgi:hypothetical protein
MKIIFNKNTQDLSITDNINIYYFDIDDYDQLTYNYVNDTLKWHIYNNELYSPVDNKMVHVLEILYNVPYTLYNWIFINNNKYDLHRKNILYSQKYYIKIAPEIKIIKSYDGRLIKLNNIYTIKNMYWFVEFENLKYYMMVCDCIIIKLNQEHIDLALNSYKNHYWVRDTKIENIYNIQYVYSNTLIAKKNKLFYEKIYLHKLIFAHHNNIDLGELNGRNILHTNGDIYDNRAENLKIEYKKERKITAKKLPVEFLCFRKEKLPKYVVYYEEKYGESEEEKNIKDPELKKSFMNERKIKINNGEIFNDSRKSREFFKIENHPKLNKVWCSSKSIKITIEEKFEETSKKLESLNIITI